MRRALCVAINNYPGTENDLHGCVNDCHDWESLLSKDFHFDSAHILLDNAATKKAIVGALREYISLTKSGDLLVFTYSGHGSWVPDTNGDEPDGRDECLCPWDIGTTGALITDDELHQLFSARAKNTRIVMVADSCHSGSVARFADPLHTAHPTIRYLSPDHFLQHHQRKISKTSVRRAEGGKAVRRSTQQALLLAACRDKEYSWDSEFGGRPNGAFTYAAIKALHSLSGEATYEDWYQAIRKRLPSHSAPQTPQLSGPRKSSLWPVFK
jgi:metacaspase-1